MMSKLDMNLVKKSGIYFIGNFASKFIMAIMIPFYAYFVSVKELGLFDFSQTIMNTVAPVIFLALWEAILRFLIAEDEENKRVNIIATSVRITQIVIAILVLFSLIFAIIGNLITMYTLLMICAYGAAQMWQYYARALKYNQVYIKSSIVGTILNFIFLLLTVCVFNMGGDGLFWSYIIGQISIVVLIEKKVYVLSYLKKGSFNWLVLKTMLLFSAPLILNLASGWLISGAGRMIITNELGTYENGLFSFAMKFGTIVSMLGTVVSMALIEEAIIKSKDDGIDEYFSRTIQIVFKLFLSIGIMAIPLVSIFYYIISSTEYKSSYNMVPIFLMYSVLMTMSTNVGAIFQARNKTNLLFYTTLSGAIITILLSYIMVNSFGVFGVSIAQLSGAFVLLMTRWVFARRFIKFDIKWGKIICLAIVYILIVAVCSNGLSIVSMLLSLLLMLIVCYLNREMVTEVLKFRRKSKVANLPQ
ncbi:polysaccharide biosynthesis C-terminal domain-containing protein [Paenibacillus glycanilyticus]|uniref:Undecaprenyl-diphospho-oligosaccharide flippase n=1 Tax=Paenibacillus glycanilyticus TaxID=126569 RepID=A0ABQ6GBI0_9BACL|nr:polysaccharide biosynthesis C-terminal domain-containing protein [Paenibacillus glycanilyticus]GLX67375.1 undecaprenyl-diphospho-oligosaccharide flippase [Paenibacillus glycanilyticus]